MGPSSVYVEYSRASSTDKCVTTKRHCINTMGWRFEIFILSIKYY